MKVLVLEDDEGVGGIIAACLEKWRQEATLVHDGQAAWDSLQSTSYDLLITDWQVPSLSGTELVKRLRQTPAYRKLPVLMISGRAGKGDIVEAVQVGINGFLTKPFTPAQLRDKIASVWKSRNRITLDQAIQQICQGHQAFDPSDDNPVILIGEAANDPAGLKRADRKDLVAYLTHLTRAIDQANKEDPDLRLGYLIETGTHDIVLRLKKRSIGKRVRMLVTSTECVGDTFLMMRSINLNRKDDFTAVLVINQTDTIPVSLRGELEKLGVTILDRTEMDLPTMQKLIGESIGQGHAPSAAEAEIGPQGVRARIEDFVESSPILPVLPRLYQRIARLAVDPNSDLKKWASFIKMDPMGCAAIYRHARTPQYGFEGRLNQVEKAVMLLGKDTVAQLIGSDGTLEVITEFQRSGFSLQEFWEHSVAVGFAAYLLSFSLNDEEWSADQRQRFNSFALNQEDVNFMWGVDLPQRLDLDLRTQEPYLGGLMHDLGKLAMVQAHPPLFKQILRQLEEEQQGLGTQAAEAVCADGLMHTEVGAQLGEMWGFEPELIQMLRLHHAGAEGGHFSFS